MPDADHETAGHGADSHAFDYGPGNRGGRTGKALRGLSRTAAAAYRAEAEGHQRAEGSAWKDGDGFGAIAAERGASMAARDRARELDRRGNDEKYMR